MKARHFTNSPSLRAPFVSSPSFDVSPASKVPAGVPWSRSPSAPTHASRLSPNSLAGYTPSTIDSSRKDEGRGTDQPHKRRSSLGYCVLLRHNNTSASPGNLHADRDPKPSPVQTRPLAPSPPRQERRPPQPPIMSTPRAERTTFLQAKPQIARPPAQQPRASPNSVASEVHGFCTECRDGQRHHSGIIKILQSGPEHLT